MTRVVIVHPEMGIYLGNCMGLGFWSKLDPVDRPSAVTFQTAADAERHMQSWDGGVPDGAATHPVEPDDFAPDGGVYASVAACVAAGLEGWESNTCIRCGSEIREGRRVCSALECGGGELPS